LDDWVFISFACSYALGALCWMAVDVTQPLDPNAAVHSSPAAPSSRAAS
jgi:hypothetical protein